MNHKLRPYSGKESFIFLSYSHRDSDQAMEIIRRLMDDGFRIWYDEGIDPGSEWDENIAAHINACDTVLALLSRNYLNSDNCKDELNFARDLNKDRLLVYLEDIQLPPGMAMRLNRLQSIHKYTYADPEDFYKKLVGAPSILRNGPAPSLRKTAPDPAPAKTPEPKPTPEPEKTPEPAPESVKAPEPQPAPKESPKKQTPQTVTPAALRKRVDGIIIQTGQNDRVFSALTPAFAKKYPAAVAEYAPVPGDETPLLLTDDSFFGNGKLGVVVTDKKIYINTNFTQKRTIPISEIFNLSIREGALKLYHLNLILKTPNSLPVSFATSSNQVQIKQLMGTFAQILFLLPQIRCVPPVSPAATSGTDLHSLVSATVRKYGVGGIYFSSETPQFSQRLPKAKVAYAQLTAGETPLLLEDFSITGSAKEGLVLTDRALYVNNPVSRKKAVPLHQISQVTCEANGRKNFCVTLRTAQGILRATSNPSEEHIRACAGCLSELITRLKQTPPSAAAPSADWTCPACGTPCTGNFCPSCGRKR